MLLRPVVAGHRSVDALTDAAGPQVHDQTLEPFVKARLTDGASATTINRSLEVVRTILNRAARSYRDAAGRPWLEAIPPLITMLPESPRSPHPIPWTEQDALFPKLPAHLGRMALVNPGLRDANLCSLRVVGGADRRTRSQRVRRSGASVQIAARARGDLE